MPDARKYYVFSDDNCKFESMTKEEILAAIVQAVSTHEISEVDTGFVTTLKEGNQGKGLKMWIGSTAEYNAIAQKEQNCLYLLTDDTELDDLETIITNLMNAYNQISLMKNDILLNQSVSFGSVNVDLIGTYPLHQYSIVKVDDVLCSVEYDSSTGNAIVKGVGTIAGSSTSLVRQYIISLSVNAADNKIVYNNSYQLDITASGQTITEKSISKIVGVY